MVASVAARVTLYDGALKKIGQLASASRTVATAMRAASAEPGKATLTLTVTDTAKPLGRLHAHQAAVTAGTIKLGDLVRLDIAERRIPQDGRIGLTLGGKLSTFVCRHSPAVWANVW